MPDLHDNTLNFDGICELLRDFLDAEQKTIFRNVCKGAPERVFQGELLAYLKKKGLNALQEGGLHKTDIVIFNSTDMAEVIIEMKHQASVQNLNTLIDAMRADIQKVRGNGYGHVQVVMGIVTSLNHMGDAHIAMDYYHIHKYWLKNGGLKRGIFSAKQVRDTEFIGQAGVPMRAELIAPESGEVTLDDIAVTGKIELVVLEVL